MESPFTSLQVQQGGLAVDSRNTYIYIYIASKLQLVGFRWILSWFHEKNGRGRKKTPKPAVFLWYFVDLVPYFAPGFQLLPLLSIHSWHLLIHWIFLG